MTGARVIFVQRPGGLLDSACWLAHVHSIFVTLAACAHFSSIVFSSDQEDPYFGCGVQRLQQRVGAHQDPGEGCYCAGVWSWPSPCPPISRWRMHTRCPVCCNFQIDPTPFKAWFEQHYRVAIGTKNESEIVCVNASLQRGPPKGHAPCSARCMRI